MKKILVNNTFGQNLQKIRYSKDLTQEQTAAKLQLLGSPMSRDVYAQIETGKGNIYISDLVGLQQVFNVDFAEFFEGVPTAR